MLQALTGSPVVCRKIEEETRAHRGLAVRRMVELGGVSRASFSRIAEEGPASRHRDRSCVTPSSVPPCGASVTAVPDHSRAESRGLEGWAAPHEAAPARG
jgi:hypothetical protein